MWQVYSVVLVRSFSHIMSVKVGGFTPEISILKGGLARLVDDGWLDSASISLTDDQSFRMSIAEFWDAYRREFA